MAHWELAQLFNINNHLRDTFEDLEDYQKALNDMYESFEGYLGIRFDFEEWTINEDGEIIERNLEESKVFYEKMWTKIYKMLIMKTFKQMYYDPEEEKNIAYDLGFRDGLAYQDIRIMEEARL